MTSVPLGSVVESVIDHRGKTPKKLGGDFTESGVEVVSAVHIKNGRIDWEQRRRFVSQEMFQRWMPERLKSNDLLLTSEAPLGEVALVPDDRDLVLSQRLFAIRGKRGVLHTPYLYYYFQGEAGRAELESRASSTTVVGIRQEELLRVPISLPPFPEQQQIAGVLGALDDLIASSDYQVSKLNELADAIFADIDFSRTELLSFGDVADVFGGGTPSTKVPQYWGGPIHWATPSDVTSLDSPYLFSTTRTITADGLSNCSSELHPPGTILMSSRATIGAFAIASVPVATNQGFIVVRPRQEIDRAFLFHEMRSRVAEFESQANGSTFLELSRGRFKGLPVRWPAESERSRLHDLVHPLHEAAASLSQEATELARVRDELLPLLMSGRIRVARAEELVA